MAPSPCAREMQSSRTIKAAASCRLFIHFCPTREMMTIAALLFCLQRACKDGFFRILDS